MPPRHRFLEPIHNVKEGLAPQVRRPKPAKIWSSYLENVERPPSRFALWRAAFADKLEGLPAEAASAAKAGGAYRDRTDDLKLAKLALSQLS